MTLFHEIVKNQILRKLRMLKSYFQRENQRVKFSPDSNRLSRKRRMFFRLVSPLIMVKSTRRDTHHVGYVSRSPVASVSLLIAPIKNPRRKTARQRRGSAHRYRPWRKTKISTALVITAGYKATFSCVPQ